MLGRNVGSCACAAVLALAFAGPAAALTPRLVVDTTEPTSTRLELEEASGGAASIVLYLPLGAALDLGLPEGTLLDRAVEADVVADGVATPLAGTLRAVAAPPALCDPGATAAWLLELFGAGGQISVPVAVRAATGPEAGYASYRLELCLPQGTAVRRLELALGNVLALPAGGRHVWRAVLGPAGGGEPVEARATALHGLVVELSGRYERASRAAVLRGRVRAGGESVAGLRVQLRSGRGPRPARAAGVATTAADGRFRALRAITAATTFRASLAMPARADPEGCPSPVAPGGCASATIGPLEAASAVVRVGVPAPPTLRLGARGAEVRRLREALVRLRYLPAGGVSSVFDERTWHAVVALQGWHHMPRDGVVGRGTWALLGRAAPPRPSGGMRFGIQIDLTRQVALLVRDGRTVRAIHVSTGAFGRTPRGRFAVYRKERLSWSVPFQTWMPWASYFLGGYAMHAYPSVPAYPASHGCVRLPAVEAPGVYAFAGFGTPVWVR